MKTICKRLILLISLIIIWYIASLHSNPVFVPSPMKVFDDLIISIKSGMMFEAIKYSFIRITIATILSACLSIPMGLLIYNFKIMDDIFHPIIKVMRYIPVTAFYPLLILWFGIGEEMKIMFLFIATFVYMMPSVILCLEEINQDLIDTGITIGMSKFQTIWKIQIPATLPSLINSFIMMYGIGWTYIAVCEQVNAVYGLGWTIQQSSSRGQTHMVFMAISVIMVVSVIFDTFSKWLVRKIFKWRYINDTIK